MQRATLTLAGAVLVGLVAAPAWAQGTPSSKAAFAFSAINILTESLTEQVEVLGDGIGDDDGLCEPDEACQSSGPDDDHLAQTVLKKTIKAPKHKDLWMNVSLECGNFADLLVRSKGGTKDTSTAGAMVRVRVKVTDNETGEVRYASPAGNDERVVDPIFGTLPVDGELGVVYCKFVQELSATFQGILDAEVLLVEVIGDGIGNDDGVCDQAEQDAGGCVADVVGTFHECLIQDETTGNVIIDPECLTFEELQLVTDQMQATSFNFLLPNLTSSGVNTVEVQAILDTGTNAQNGSSNAKATVGLGSMIVQTLRLVKDDDGSTIEID